MNKRTVMKLARRLPVALLCGAAALGSASPARAQDAASPPPAPPPAAPVVAAPAPAAPAPAAPPTSGQDTASPPASVDLAALGLRDESQTASESEHPLQLYGFADVTYYLPFFPKDSFLAAQIPENQQFVMGNFNLYLAKQISERLRALGEVRFLYLPNGQISGNSYTSTQVDDPANLYRPIRWGGIEVERLHIEYDLLSNLTIRAGQFLTPYGIWNVDHGTPTIIPIRRPYVIGEALFPERQVGLELFGRSYLSELAVEYHLTLSNGRGPIDETRDLDTNKAVGARLLLEWRHELDLKVGFSYFRGRYTNATPVAFDVMMGRSTSTILEQYDEQAAGADLSLDAGGVVVRAEILESEHRYVNGYRGTGPTFIPDNRRWGTYGLVGYRLPHGLLPFFIAQYYKWPETPGNTLNPSVQAYQGGLDYRLHPSVILKLELTYATIASSPVPLIRDTPVKTIETQVSWVF
jgi:hypothetical protein